VNAASARVSHSLETETALSFCILILAGTRALPPKEATMDILRIAILVVGILAILIGLVWIGQGTGYFPYPASSFMINQMPWVYRGAVLAVLGLVAVMVSRWM
jgi:MFS superfamily sulfate permease-like transporter